jgi:hypothetical protein
MQIISNNQTREIVYGYALPQQWRNEFDYYNSEDLDSAAFFKYKNQYYDLNEFMRTPDTLKLLGWHGISNDSYFSGILIRLSDCGDAVTVARYYS